MNPRLEALVNGCSDLEINWTTRSSAGQPLPESRLPDQSHIYISNAGSSNSNKCFRIPEALVEEFVREYTLRFFGMFQSGGNQGLKSISISVTSQDKRVVYCLADKTLVFPNRSGTISANYQRADNTCVGLIGRELDLVVVQLGIVGKLVDPLHPDRKGAKDYMVGFEYNIFTTTGHEEEIIKTVKLTAFGRSDLERYAVPGIDKYK